MKKPSATKKPYTLDPRPLLKIGQAAKALGVSIDTLRRWERAGKIEATRTPGGTRLYSLSGLKKINPQVVSDFEAKSLTTEELLKRAAEETDNVILNDSEGSLDFKSLDSSVTSLPQNDNLKQSFVNKFLIGTGILSAITLAITSWIAASYLTQPKATQEFFKNNVASGLLAPFNKLAEESVAVISPQKAKELGFIPPEEPPPLYPKPYTLNPNVLAVTASPQFLEINSDTQINGALFVRDQINNLSLEGTPSASTITLSSGETVLTVSNDATLDQDVSTTSTPAFNFLNLSATSNQLVFQSGGLASTAGGPTGTLTWTPTAARVITLPDATTTLVGRDTTDTLKNKSISGSDNTLTAIPNSALSNSKVTVTAGTNLTGGGDVTLGSSITLSLKSSPAVSGVLSLADGTAAAPSLTFSDDADTGLYRIGSNSIGLITGGSATSGLMINSSGFIGVGTSSPAARLSVAGNVGIGSSYANYASPANGLIVEGNVGIGTSAPGSYALNVGGNVNITGTLTTSSDITFSNLNAGSVIFAGSGSTLSQNNPNFYWDNTDNRLGIGTSAPSSALTVLGGNVGIGTSAAGATLQVNGGGLFGWGTASVAAPSNGLAVFGNVGIGTTSTAAPLHVVNYSTSDVVRIQGPSSSTNLILTAGSTQAGEFTASTSLVQINAPVASQAIRLITQGIATQGINILAGGNVGIGTTVPNATLSIQGNVGIGYTGANQAIPSNGLAVFGNVGIGITTANSALTVAGGTTIGTGFNVTAPTNGLLVQGNVGIGFTSPTALTHLVQTAAADAFRVDDVANDTTPFIIDQSGNVGIGFTTPRAPIHIRGDEGILQPGVAGNLFIEPLSDGGDVSFLFKTTETDTDRYWNIRAGSGGANPTTNFRIYDATAQADRFNIDSSGNIGIGDSAASVRFPQAQLHITQTDVADALRIEDAGGDNSPFVINLDGNVGIANSAPSYALDVVGTTRISGDTTLSSDLAVNGGDLTTTATSFNLINATATTVNFAGAATTLSIGASTGTTTINNTLAIPSGSASTPSLTFTGDTNTGLYRFASDGIALITGGASTNLLSLNSSGNVGIGTTSPGATLHLIANATNNEGVRIQKSGSEGSVYGPIFHSAAGSQVGFIGLNTSTGAMTLAADLNNSGIFAFVTRISSTLTETVRITNAGNVGIGFTSPTANLHVVNTAAQDSFRVDDVANDISPFVIDQSGKVFIGDTANADLTAGLTINQGGADDEILAFKSSDIAHGVTDRTETDTYAYFYKADANAGGLWIEGVVEQNNDSPAIRLVGGSTGDTLRTSSARGIVEINSYESAPTGGGQTVAGSNIFAIRENDATRLTVDDDGTIYIIPSTVPASGFTTNISGVGTSYFMGGNLGIGTTSPSQLFQVNTNASNPVVITSGGNVGIGFTSPTANLHILNTASQDSFRIDDVANDTSPFVINLDGNVGIGATTSSNKLDVWGNSRLAGTLTVDSTGTFGGNIVPNTNDGSALGTSSLMWSDLFLASGGVINFNNGDITLTHATDTLGIAGGNVGIGTTIPNRAGLGSAARVLTIEGQSSSNGGVLEILGPNVGTGNEIGRIYFGRTAGTGPDGSVTGAALIWASSLDGNDDTSLVFSTSNAGTVARRMTIDNTGNVGIGYANSPGAALSVNGNIGIGTSSATGGSLIVASGNVGIGFTSPTALTHIVQTAAADAFRVDDVANDSSPFVISQTGNVGIWNASPSYPVDITYTEPSSALQTTRVINIDITSNYGSTDYGLYSTIQDKVGQSVNIYPVYGYGQANTNDTYSGIIAGVRGDASLGGNAVGKTAATLIGVYGYVTNGSAQSNIVTNAYGFYSDVNNASTNTIGSRYGFYATNPTNSGTITNNYGLYIANQTAGSADYGVYVAGADTAAAYFGGNVGIGFTSPTALTHLVQTAAADAFRVDDVANDTSPFIINQDGNLGIGATTSSNKLDVWGNSRLAGTLTVDSNSTIGGTLGVTGALTLSANNAALSFTGTTPSLTSGSSVFGLFAGGNVGIGTTGNVYGGLTVRGAGTGTNITLQTYGSNLTQGLTVLDNGNVGIGTTAPTALLNIAGASKEFHLTDGSAVSYGATMRFRKSRGTVAAPTIAVTGDELLTIVAQGYDGAAFQNAASIRMYATGTLAADKMPGYIGFFTTPANSVIDLERMRIDSGGNVGIGTSSPGALLGVLGGVNIGGGTSRFAEKTGPANGLAVEGNVGIGTTTANSNLSIAGNAHIGSLYQGIVAPTNGLFVDGNVGIGATTSNNLLDVWGNSRLAGTLTVDSTGTFGGNVTVSDGTNDIHSIDTSGAVVFNEQQSDIDFRIESDTNANHFVSDAGLFTGVGAFGIGTAAVNYAHVFLDHPALNTVASTNFFRMLIDNTNAITIPSGTASYVGTLNIDEPNILENTGTVTNAFTLRVGDAPTEGDNNYALWVDAGTSRFDGDIDARGNVGIGFTSPAATLDVIGTSFLRGTAGTYGLAVTSAGNVGIGTTSPFGKLQVVGGNVGIGTFSDPPGGPYSPLEIRGTAGASGFATAKQFNAMKLGLNSGTEWGGQAQFWIGRYEENSSNARTALTISLAHGGIAPSSDADADIMTLLSSGNVGIGFTSPTANLHVLNTAAQDSFRIDDVANDTSPFIIDQSGKVFIGDTTNANLTAGLTINQGGADDEILAFKSSDIAHGLTDITETDTYAFFRKAAADTGGLELRAFQEASNVLPALLLYVGSTGDTTRSTTGRAAVEVNAFLTTSTGGGTFTADGSIFGIRKNESSRFLFDAEGTMHVIAETVTDSHGLAHAAMSIGSGSAYGLTYGGTGNLTITGNSTNFFQNRFTKVDVTAASALTIDNAATIYIDNAPQGIGAGPATITNAYALWVDAGLSRFDGSVTSEGSVFGLFAGGNVGIGTTGNVYGGLTVRGAGTSTGITLQTYGSGLGQGLSVLDNGNVGIGTTAPATKLQVVHTHTASEEAASGSLNVTSNMNAVDGSTAAAYGRGLTVSRPGTKVLTSNTILGYTAYHLDILRDQGTDAGTMTNQIGVDSRVGTRTGVGNVTTTNVYGFKTSLSRQGGTISNYYGLNVGLLQEEAAGTVTNTYGVYVGDITYGTQTNTPFSFYASDASALNYFAGNVGIGFTSPTALTHIVQTAAADAFRVDDVANDTSPFVIEQGGNVGVGIAAPGAKLDVRDSAENTIAAFYSTNTALATGRDIVQIRSDDTTNPENYTLLDINRNGTSLVVFQGSGNVGIGATSPDAQLQVQNGTAWSRLNAGDSTFAVSSSRTIKENFNLVSGSGILDKIQNVPVYTYDYISGPTDKMGLVAEDFYTIFGRGDGTSINYQEVAMASWLGIQELYNRTQSLESQLYVSGSGNVGIGTTNPLAKLDVAGNARISGNLDLGAATIASSSGNLTVQFSSDTVAGVPTQFIIKNSLGQGLFSVDASGSARLAGTLTTEAGAFDVAEDYTVEDNTIEAGDVVSIADHPGPLGPELVAEGLVEGSPVIEKSTQTYQNNLLGIISTKAALRLSSADSSEVRPVALNGRVPVKVSTENGPIQKGDYLTSSSTPGVAMKAIRPGQVVGKALEPFDGSSTDYSLPTTAEDGSPKTVDNLAYGKILAFVNVSFADPGNFLASLSMDDQGNLIIPKIRTASITLDPSIASASAQLSIDNGQLTIDNGQWTINVAEKFATQSAQIANLDLQVATASASIASQSTQLASASAELASIRSEMESLKLTPPDILLASGSATLASITVSEATISAMLTAYSAQIQDHFKVLGETTIGDTIVAGQLTIDGTLSIENGNSINVISTLYLQNSPLSSSIDIFNGKIIIDASGNITSLGKVIAPEVKTNKLTISNTPIASGSATLAASIGTGTIPANQTKVTILTTDINISSKVFITPTTPTDRVLSVTNIKNGESFDVSILTPTLIDINFNWWIVQTE